MTYTVLTGEVSHETNTFNILPTTYDSFAESRLFLGDRAVAERGAGNTDLAGFRTVGARRNWHSLHAISAAAPPLGIVTRDAFDRITAPILTLARRHLGGLDGILLALHGAMVADLDPDLEDGEDGEGALLARLRDIVGPDMPIAITLDPHANVTQRMCDLSNIIVSYKTYPHVDMRERAEQAADLLHRAMAGEIKPRTLRAHRAMLEEVNGGRTDRGPMLDRIAKAVAYETEPGVHAVSINAGFGNADIKHVGPTVLVTYEAGDPRPHRVFADAIADDIWDKRFLELNTYLTVEEAAARGKAHDGNAGPLVIADYADNPGGGAYGDATNLLAALLDAGVTNACVAPIVDPTVPAALADNAPGETVTVSLGGKTDPRYGGEPLSLTGTLTLLSDGEFVGDGPILGGLRGNWGKTAVLTVSGIDILVVSHRQQMLDLQQLKSFGIDPNQKTVLAVKSMQHFRAAFEPIAAEIIVCDSGALCSPDLTRLPFEKVPRTVYPLSEDGGVRSEAQP